MGFVTKYISLVSAIALLTLLAAVPACSGVVCYLDANGGPTGVTIAGADTPTAVVTALASPPAGYASAVPVGTQVLSFIVEPDTTSVDFSKEILSLGIDEARLEFIYEQVRITLAQFSLPGSVRISAGGTPLYKYLPPDPDIAPSPEAQRAAGQVPISTVGLGGKKISLSPGHGQYWLGSYWVFDRGVYC